MLNYDFFNQRLRLILNEKIYNSELVIFENSGHWVYIEEEELFLNTVNEWLART